MRMVFYLIAILSMLLLFAIGGATNIIFESKTLMKLFVVLGIIAFIILVGFWKKQYKSGQICVFTESYLKNEIPKSPIKFGLNWVNTRFPTNTIFQLIIKTIKLIKSKIKKDNSDLKLFQEIKSIFLFTIVGFVPYLGTCIISWTYMHPDDDLLKCVVEGTEAFMKNISKLILTIIKNFLLTIFLLSINLVIVMGLVILFFTLSKFGITVFEILEIITRASYVQLVITITVLLVGYVIFEYIAPFGSIDMVRKFVMVINNNDEDYSKLYIKYANARKKVIAKFKSNKNKDTN